MGNSGVVYGPGDGRVPGASLGESVLINAHSARARGSNALRRSVAEGLHLAADVS